MEVGKVFPFKTIGELKQEFYELMRLPRKPKSNKIRVMEPHIFVKNPPMIYDSSSPIAPEIYVAVYFPYQTSRGSLYYVKIECGRSVMQGPHKFELYYQIRKGNHIRLGCYMPEIDFAFHREDIVKQRLRKAIIFNKYFASQQTEELSIELRTDDTEDIKINQ